MFEVTKDPTSHPELHIFLQRVIGFDSVDDESKAERRLYRKFPLPKDWTTTQNRKLLLRLTSNGSDALDSSLQLLALLSLLEYYFSQQLATFSWIQ